MMKDVTEMVVDVLVTGSLAVHVLMIVVDCQLEVLVMDILDKRVCWSTLTELEIMVRHRTFSVHIGQMSMVVRT